MADSNFDLSKALTDAEAKYDIPDGIYERLILKGERSGQTATSPAGAYGYAQLMPAAAQDMHVDRMDPAQNVLGGAHYLRTLYDRFGDWDQAVAHYNAGPSGNINNSETRDYFRRVQGRDMPDSMTNGQPATGGAAPPGQLMSPQQQAEMDAMLHRGIQRSEAADQQYGQFLDKYEANTDRIMKEYDSEVHNPIPKPPEPPNLKDAPNGNDFMHNPTSVLQQTLPLMAVFAGGLTRRHAIGAMKAAAAAMNAQKTNDKEAFDRAHEKWKDDTQQMLQQYTLMRQEYSDIMDNRSMSMQERLGELQQWAAQNQVAQARQALGQGDLGRVESMMQVLNANAYRNWQVYDAMLRHEHEQAVLDENIRYHHQMAGNQNPKNVAYNRAYQDAIDAGKGPDEAEREAETALAGVSAAGSTKSTDQQAVQWRKVIQADKRTQAWQTEQQFVQALNDVDPKKMDEGPTQKLVIDAFNRLATNQAARKFLIDAGDQGLLNKADMFSTQLLSTKGPVMGTDLAKRYYDAAKKMAGTIEEPYDHALAETAAVMDQDGLNPVIAIDQSALQRIQQKGYWTPSNRLKLEQNSSQGPTAAGFKPGTGALPDDLPPPKGLPEGSKAKDGSGKVVAVIHQGQWAAP